MEDSSAVRLFGIPIQIDPSWFAVLLLMTWSLSRGYFPSVVPGLSSVAYGAMGLLAALLLFVCVLLHELGHSLMAMRLGIPVARVKLFFFGGVAQIRHDSRRPSVEFAVAIAGPIVSALIAWGCVTAVRRVEASSAMWLVLRAILHYLAMINVALIAFNLLPGLPLDGGRLVRAVLWAWTGSVRKATRIAGFLGVALGLALIALGVWVVLKGSWVGGLWYVLLGVFLRNAALVYYRAARVQE